MSNHKKYIALTLGPIYRTLMLAQSSKELWTASYLFSYLGKKIIEPFIKNTFVLPIVDDDRLSLQHKGAGLYPDRYIFEALEGDFDALVKKVDEVIVHLANNITNDSKVDECTIFLKNYLKIYFLEFEHGDSNTLVDTCNRQLSILELQDNFNPIEKDNFLTSFFEKVDGGSFLAHDAFEPTVEEENRLFESLIELAIPECREFVTQDVRKRGDGDEERILAQLKFEKKFRSYYRYIAIIKADGDSVGKTIANLQECGIQVIDLARQMFEFNLKVIEIVNQYKGRSIYLGGDDLLVFAPLKFGNRHLFSLVEQINQAFDEAMKRFDERPTLSFGISMMHFKSPMFEALEKTESLLIDKAKELPGKNAIAFSLQKKSGHHIEAVIPKGQSVVYDIFKEVIDAFMNNPSDKVAEKAKLLSSVMHWLGRNKEMLRIILGDQESERTSRLANYFANSFNEKVHDSYRNFLSKVQQLVLNTYAHSDNIETTIQTVYATLRFVHLLNSDNDE